MGDTQPPVEGDKTKQPTAPVPGPPPTQPTFTPTQQPQAASTPPVQEKLAVTPATPVASSDEANGEVPEELHEYREVADGVQARVRTPEEREESAKQLAEELSAQN